MWDLIAAHDTAHGQLALYTHGQKEYLIRFDGIELMNSLLHTSEDVLGELALACCPPDVAQPRILIGGLGLGFTLAACLRAQGGSQQAEVQVAELMPAIIDWYRQYFCRIHDLQGNEAGLLCGDVYQLLASHGPYHMICLDIDNGPSYLATDSNQRMYDAAGLALLRSRLHPGGRCLIWSASTEEALVATARAAGWHCLVRNVHMPVNGRTFSHHIYLLSPDLPSVQLQQKLQLEMP